MPSSREKAWLCGKYLMNFFEHGLSRLAASALTKDCPAYVQFYVTARCNLSCRYCNIIYANADLGEVSTEDSFRIAENLGKIGTSVALLTGGEPFVRKDLILIAQAMLQNGIHPRIQTNGFAKREQLEQMAALGLHDISISLDSLLPELQNDINGGHRGSWNSALETISLVNEIFPPDSFAALGCVLSPRNLEHITSVIDFATQIGWWVSLVPAHTTISSEPRNFSTYDPSHVFPPESLERVHQVLDKARRMRNQGYNLYDADEYLDDILRFVSRQPIQWRRRNGGVCDSPNLYFVVMPNGDMAPCCDYRLPFSLPVQDPGFPEKFRDRRLRAQIRAITSQCSGCMYGSFPEISISSRFFRPMLARGHLFLSMNARKRGLKRLSAAQMMDLANEIMHAHGLAETA